MISAFRMGPTASGRRRCDRVLFRVAKSLVKKLFLHEENIPIISKIEKPKLSLDFCLTRTLNKLATFNKTLDITQFASAGYQTPTKYRSHGIYSNYRDSATAARLPLTLARVKTSTTASTAMAAAA